MYPYTVTRYMRENGNSFWSVSQPHYYNDDSGVVMPPRVYGRMPIQCDVYPPTIDRGEVAEIIALTLKQRGGEEGRIEGHKLFLQKVFGFKL